MLLGWPGELNPFRPRETNECSVICLWSVHHTTTFLCFVRLPGQSALPPCGYSLSRDNPVCCESVFLDDPSLDQMLLDNPFENNRRA